MFSIKSQLNYLKVGSTVELTQEHCLYKLIGNLASGQIK